MFNAGIGAALIGLAVFSSLFNFGSEGKTIRELLIEKLNKADSTVSDDSFLRDGLGLVSEADTFPGVNIKRNIAYGTEGREVMDLYTSDDNESGELRPVIMMVHGGAWKWGDKTGRYTVDNKVKYFLPRGYAFISINYPLENVDPEEQVHSVGKALAYIQSNAAVLGTDPDRIVIMGHSAGAHLVALLTGRTDVHSSEGILPWRGTVPLDGAMYDTASRMAVVHPKIYDEPFGTDPVLWELVSPYAQYKVPGAPILFTCSTQRPDKPCLQSNRFAKKIMSVGGRAEVLPVDGGHGQVNEFVGMSGVYTETIQTFLTSIGMP